jgi:hypothetical protein
MELPQVFVSVKGPVALIDETDAADDPGLLIVTD